jgi:EmrB/QacA subfamily drug resistance transporter
MSKLTTKQNSWLILLLLSSAQFIVVLDTTVINIALPSIQAALNFSPQNLQWVSNAYLLVFAGFLLLGGRIADVLGRRRIFASGLILFALASLLGGLALSEGWLIGARVGQGLGAALISPAALSILTVTFKEGKEREAALGVFGAAAGTGAVAGALLGGILTQFFGWQAVFVVNVPIATMVALLSLRFVSESRLEAENRGKGFDFAGALTVTAGLVLLVYGLVQAPELGWNTLWALAYFVAAFSLLGLFVIIELHTAYPMVDFTIFRYRRLRGANLIVLLFTPCIGGTLYLLSLYLQQVLVYSALQAGLALLPFQLATIIAATGSAQLVTRFGVRPVVMSGLISLTGGLVLLSQLSAKGEFLSGVLPATLLFGLGLTGTGIPLTIAAVSEVPLEEAGLASGLLNTTQQVGFSLGLAILATVASSYTATRAVSNAESLTDGFRLAFTVATGFAITSLILSFVLLAHKRPVAKIERSQAKDSA